MEFKITSTAIFDKWLKSIKDKRNQDRLILRIRNMQFGHFGDSKTISDNLLELRFFFGAGFRIYYTIRHGEVILLLNGGDKSSQSKDIKKAHNLIDKLENIS